jgi:hypothetical protein
LPPKAEKVSFERTTNPEAYASRSIPLDATGRPIRSTSQSATTCAPDAETPNTALSSARSVRARKALTPLRAGAWRQKLAELGLSARYASIVNGIEFGFTLGTQPITKNFHPPNSASADEYAEVLQREIQKEVDLGRYLGPYTAAEIEAVIGPFQTSPQSVIPKLGKPGKYRLIRNLSAPRVPYNGIASINSQLQASDHPHTWGTFWTVVCLIIDLPEGSEGASEDVKDAYRSIPIRPEDWPALVVRGGGEDVFYGETCLCFGAVPGDGLFGEVADAYLDTARAEGLGPVVPWIDDSAWFRILRTFLTEYNDLRARKRERIRKLGGEGNKGARRWWTGGPTPSGKIEEFAEELTYPIRDVSERGPAQRSDHDERFTYAACDIHHHAEQLSWVLGPEKRQPFGPRVEFTGLDWGVQARNVGIVENKRIKYIGVLEDFLGAKSVTLREVESVYGKLQHCTTVLPEGRAYLVSLSRDRAMYNGHEHARHHLSRSTRSDLDWWRSQLGRQIPPRPLPYATAVADPHAFSDTSSKVGIAIWINGWWRAWRLRRGWESKGRNIAWAEAVGFELLVRALGRSGASGDTLLWGDNRVVVEGWWRGSSNSIPVNSVFKRVHVHQRELSIRVHTRYVPSADNPADDPSRSVYRERSRLLAPMDLGDLDGLVYDFEDPRADRDCLPIASAVTKPRGLGDYSGPREIIDGDARDAIAVAILEQSC